MSSKIVFAFLVVLIAAAITATVMVKPAENDPDADADGPAPAPAPVQPTGPRADVQLTSAPVGNEVGDRAPAWTLKDPSGRTHRLQDYLGQVVVMDFWATWCGPCKSVMPDLQAFHEDYESRGVNVLGMNGWERGGDPVKFMETNNYTYGLMLNSEPAMSAYGVRGIPTICVVGVNGEIIYKHIGVTPDLDEELAKVIEPHLEEHGL